MRAGNKVFLVQQFLQKMLPQGLGRGVPDDCEAIMYLKLQVILSKSANQIPHSKMLLNKAKSIQESLLTTRNKARYAEFQTQQERSTKCKNPADCTSIVALREITKKHSLKMFHRNIFKIYLTIMVNKGKRSCSLPLEMLSHFSPHSPCAGSMAQVISPSADGDHGLFPTVWGNVPKGQKGRARGACPWTPPAFLKNCWTKKLLLILFFLKLMTLAVRGNVRRTKGTGSWSSRPLTPDRFF